MSHYGLKPDLNSVLCASAIFLACVLIEPSRAGVFLSPEGYSTKHVRILANATSSAPVPLDGSWNFTFTWQQTGVDAWSAARGLLSFSNNDPPPIDPDVLWRIQPAIVQDHSWSYEAGIAYRESQDFARDLLNPSIPLFQLPAEHTESNSANGAALIPAPPNEAELGAVATVPPSDTVDRSRLSGTTAAPSDNPFFGSGVSTSPNAAPVLQSGHGEDNPFLNSEVGVAENTNDSNPFLSAHVNASSAQPAVGPDQAHVPTEIQSVVSPQADNHISISAIAARRSGGDSGKSYPAVKPEPAAPRGAVSTPTPVSLPPLKGQSSGSQNPSMMPRVCAANAVGCQ